MARIHADHRARGYCPGSAPDRRRDRCRGPMPDAIRRYGLLPANALIVANDVLERLQILHHRAVVGCVDDAADHVRDVVDQSDRRPVAVELGEEAERAAADRGIREAPRAPPGRFRRAAPAAAAAVRAPARMRSSAAATTIDSGRTPDCSKLRRRTRPTPRTDRGDMARPASSVRPAPSGRRQRAERASSPRTPCPARGSIRPLSSCGPARRTSSTAARASSIHCNGARRPIARHARACRRDRARPRSDASATALRTFGIAPEKVSVTV